MSTSWGYRCTSHDPPLTSEKWLNHGAETLTELLDKRASVVETLSLGDASIHAPDWWRWLGQHPTCAVEVVNEYGETVAEEAAHRARLRQAAIP